MSADRPPEERRGEAAAHGQRRIAPEILDRLRRTRHVVLDLDGTVYLGGRVFPWTLPFIERLARLRIGHTFLTNNNSRSFSEYVERLARIGLRAGPGTLYTSTLATIEHLRDRAPLPRRLYILGAPGLRDDLVAAGFEEAGEGPEDPPDAVVVGFDTTLRYERLARAAWWIARGKPFIATHPDRICPTDAEIVLPDCAAICAALETAAGRRPDVVLGKPSPRMVQGAVRGRGIPIDETAVVGDRLYTDLAMARESGALGVLVLSGETTPAMAAAHPDAADVVVRDLGELGEILEAVRGGEVRPGTSTPRKETR